MQLGPSTRMGALNLIDLNIASGSGCIMESKRASKDRYRRRERFVGLLTWLPACDRASAKVQDKEVGHSMISEQISVPS